ncbi:MAG TPA: M20 family metallopeptidase [Tissierellales bacterium]|nr:M20 family metallopeptidase [Tissierellales bacterium]
MEVIDILKDLIKIDTTNPPGNEKNITQYIISLFGDYDKINEIDLGNNRASLVIDIEGDSDETVALIGHIDTVPVTDLDIWKYNPFGAHIEGNLMYGRGTSDMKSGLACMIYTGLYFVNNNIKPSKNIKLIFTADEEATGKGILSILDENILDDVDFIIVPENTDECIAVKEKGALWIQLELFGRSAHGARPDLGINSIEVLYELVNSIRPFVESYCGDELLGDSTVSINEISGGEKTNIIADYCKANIDIRTNPDITNEEVLDYIEKQIERFEHKYEELNVKYKVITDRPALEMNKGHNYVQEFVNTLEKLDMKTEYKGVNYFTDLSLTMPKLPKPFIIYGPGYEALGHKVDEYVSIEAVKRVSKAYIEYLR